MGGRRDNAYRAARAFCWVRVPLATLAVLVLLGCAAGTSGTSSTGMPAARGASSASPSPSVPATWQANWAGYSLHPASGFVSWAGAVWTVPKVDCATAPTGDDSRTARAAVWVGLWGGPNTGQGLADAWLPQVGTVSHCQVGQSVPPAYNATVQMFHVGGCDVPGDSGCTPQVIDLPVQYGDRIDAEVEYHGTGHGINAGEYAYQYFIADVTSGAQQSGVLYTGQAILRSQVEYQGGAIVEDNNDAGGLAKFATPVSFTKFSAGDTAGNPIPESQAIGWHMYISGHELARLGSLNGGGFKVTWQSWN